MLLMVVVYIWREAEVSGGCAAFGASYGWRFRLLVALSLGAH